MSTYKNLISLGAAAVFALGLAACSSSGDGPPPVDSTEFVGKYILSGGTISGLDADDTTVTVAKDETLELPDNLGSVTCVSDGGCTGTVSDGTLTITGNIRIDSIGSGFSHAVAAAVKKSSLFVAALPKPTPPSVAAPADCTDAACVKHYSDELTKAKEALAALLKTDYTVSQKKAADEAVADAQKDYDDAVAAQKAYAAAQPPMYGMKAMDTAIKTPATTLPSTPDGTPSFAADGASSAVKGGKVTVPVSSADSTNTYAKATWPVGTISGWTGNVWEMSDDTNKTKDSVVVYTDIKAATPAAWNAYYGASAAPANHSAWKVVSATAEAAGDNTLRTVTIGNTSDAQKAAITKNNGLFSITALGSGSNDSISVPGTDDTATTDVKENERAGTFRGIAGMYVCGTTATGCGIQNDDKGKLKAFLGAWTFRPNEPTGSATAASIKVAGVKLDTDYIDFGYWVQTNMSGDADSYKVAAFFRGQSPRTTLPSGETLSAEQQIGKATYSGGAAGLYTKWENKAGGTTELQKAGRFTATANLTAVFGSPNTIPSIDHNRIKGTISQFMDGGQLIDPAWSLSLDRNDDDDNLSGGDFSGDTSGGGPKGEWNGKFYGGANDGTSQPTGVAGKFTGSFGNGRVVGAFGATQ